MWGVGLIRVTFKELSPFNLRFFNRPKCRPVPAGPCGQVATGLEKPVKFARLGRSIPLGLVGSSGGLGLLTSSEAASVPRGPATAVRGVRLWSYLGLRVCC